ncbi:hypothetical protein MFUL124B02_08905 [Myxococcus fulvus 124B02]|nr:hypothetical protein MFUL124B02_08905 [Myxococcus fulvus 124B02]
MGVKMPPGLSAREVQDLYDRYAPGMYRRAFALLQREADAWDAVQESCIRGLQSAAGFRREARPMTFIYRVTTNVSLNLLVAEEGPRRFALGWPCVAAAPSAPSGGRPFAARQEPHGGGEAGRDCRGVG